MPVHFAAARTTARSPLARMFARKEVGRAVNDNGDVLSAFRFGASMTAALRHFAMHGMSAVEVASREAKQAHDAGDIGAYAEWLDLCRALDRRRANRLERQLDQGSSLIY